MLLLKPLYLETYGSSSNILDEGIKNIFFLSIRIDIFEIISGDASIKQPTLHASQRGIILRKKVKLNVFLISLSIILCSTNILQVT